mmetsp:Transcript_21854/g.53563  ORF Transcript_21854/g.53563 Transcript_21854/m.53563 type:complete len:209 (+) Transcript_21854:192-818(+)
MLEFVDASELWRFRGWMHGWMHGWVCRLPIPLCVVRDECDRFGACRPVSVCLSVFPIHSSGGCQVKSVSSIHLTAGVGLKYTSVSALHSQTTLTLTPPLSSLLEEGEGLGPPPRLYPCNRAENPHSLTQTDRQTGRPYACLYIKRAACLVTAPPRPAHLSSASATLSSSPRPHLHPCPIPQPPGQCPSTHLSQEGLGHHHRRQQHPPS